MSDTITTLSIEILKTHPWQENIPDMKGEDWEDFVTDVVKHGFKHAIVISTRTGVY